MLTISDELRIALTVLNYFNAYYFEEITKEEIQNSIEYKKWCILMEKKFAYPLIKHDLMLDTLNTLNIRLQILDGQVFGTSIDTNELVHRVKRCHEIVKRK